MILRLIVTDGRHTLAEIQLKEGTYDEVHDLGMHLVDSGYKPDYPKHYLEISPSELDLPEEDDRDEARMDGPTRGDW